MNAFQTIGFVSVVQLLLAESFPTEIRSMRYHQISVYIIHVSDLRSQEKRTTPMHPEYLRKLGCDKVSLMLAGRMRLESVEHSQQ